MKSISCKEAVNYILKKEQGRLSISGHVQLWRHLVVCSLCRVFAVQSKMMNKLIQLKKATPEHRLSKDEKENIIRQVLKRDHD